jgi:hypothetical protein
MQLSTRPTATSTDRTMCAEARLVLPGNLGGESELALMLCLAFMHLATVRVGHLQE